MNYSIGSKVIACGYPGIIVGVANDSIGTVFKVRFCRGDSSWLYSAGIGVNNNTTQIAVYTILVEDVKRSVGIVSELTDEQLASAYTIAEILYLKRGFDHVPEEYYT